MPPPATCGQPNERGKVSQLHTLRENYVKAVVLVRNGPPEQAFEIQELPDPRPAAGEVRIEVSHFGLNFADVSARLGTYRDAPPLPSVIGYEVVGAIDAVGADVSGFAVGQRVTALTRFGGYATKAITDARAVAPISNAMDPGVAAAMPTQGCTAVFAAEEMVRLHPGDHVLVQAAAGGVGTLLVQLAKRHGCVVYGTAGSDAKLETLRELGVDVPINYRKHDFFDVIRGQRGDDGLDVVFDSLGGSAVRRGLQLLAPGGRMVCFGAASHTGGGSMPQVFRDIQFAASFGFPHPIPLLLNSKSIIGINMLRLSDARPLVLKRCLERVVRLTADGKLTPIVGARYTVDDIAAAHAFLEGRGSTGKIVISWE